jgi:hypothetical protein
LSAPGKILPLQGVFIISAIAGEKSENADAHLPVLKREGKIYIHKKASDIINPGHPEKKHGCGRF